MKYLLAHDLGTTGNKATLFDEEGNLIARTFSPYETFYPRINWAEQDALRWWKAVCLSTQELLHRSRTSSRYIKSVSFSGQMMGCLPVDKKQTPLRNAIIWADQRSVNQAQKIREILGEEEIYRITGHRISPTYSAAKILWIKENQPEIYHKTFKFLHAKDYAILRLTGKIATDFSDASGMNLFDLKKKDWSEKILLALNIPRELLPDPYPSTQVIGEVTEEAATASGLAKGTPVVLGGGDGPCAAVGAGVVGEGVAYNYVGSSSWIALARPDPIYDPQMRTFNFYHLDPEMIMPTGTMQCAGGSYQWLKDNICRIENQAASLTGVNVYEIMNLEAEKVAPGSGNVLFLPYLMGERSPHWNPHARGVFLGFTMAHQREHLIRSVLEGVAFNLRIILDAFREQGARIEQMRVIGGGARGKLWRQIMADIYEMPILQPVLLEEATSLGAAIAGGIGTGIFKDFTVAEKLVKIVEKNIPDPLSSEKYQKLYSIFRKAYRALLPIYEELASLD